MPKEILCDLPFSVNGERLTVQSPDKTREQREVQLAWTWRPAESAPNHLRAKPFFKCLHVKAVTVNPDGSTFPYFLRFQSGLSRPTSPLERERDGSR
ncbi:hypothetical protein J6590_064322 [Homalodisca vitripennis]|nr:hypothetical protein J6590_064322 [Homalodisca vitripennis]